MQSYTMTKHFVNLTCTRTGFRIKIRIIRSVNNVPYTNVYAGLVFFYSHFYATDITTVPTKMFTTNLYFIYHRHVGNAIRPLISLKTSSIGRYTTIRFKPSREEHTCRVCFPSLESLSFDQLERIGDYIKTTTGRGESSFVSRRVYKS